MDDARLAIIKTMLGITGNYHDELLKAYGAEVEQYLLDAGVKKEVLALSEVTGIYARGIADLWNYGAGEGKFSPYFLQRAIQLTLKTVPETDETVEPLNDDSSEAAKWRKLSEVLLEEVEKNG